MVSIKSRTAIEKMRKAGYIVMLTHKAIEDNISSGVTTRELDRIAEEIIIKNSAIPSFKGVSGFAGAPKYPASICASVNEEIIHGIPDGRVLKEGDIISIDIGAYIDGYHGDAARTYKVGKVSKEAEHLIDVTKESFFRGIANAVKGMRIGDIGKEIQNYVEANGYSVVREFVGHGIGREMHEEPQIPNYKDKSSGPRLLPGMTLAIEPMVNIGTCEIKVLSNKWTVVTKDGKLSAHYENTILITENEPEIITILR